MQELACTAERFLRDVAEHEMTIVKDDGLFRHIEFRKPGTNSYMFHLTTWPGHLCISGDMGTAVFSRIADMFAFFYEPEDRREDGLFINPGYWSEKLQGFNTTNRHRSAQEYSPRLAEESIRAHVAEYLEEEFPEPEDHSDGDEESYAEYLDKLETYQAQLQELNEQLDEHIFDDMESESEEVLVHRIHYWDENTEASGFEDLFENIFDDGCPSWTEYTFHYIWLCYAISYGVIQYYNSKGGPNADEA